MHPRSARPRGLTDGAIVPALLLLSWPIVLSNLLQTAYNIADTFWLGRLGDYAVAAISVSFPIIFLFISLGAGLTIAGTALVAQYIGAERDADANYIASQTVGFVFILAVILSFLGYWFSEHVVSLMGPEPDVFADAVVYLRTWFIGIPFIFGFFIFQALIKGYGDTVNPMKLMVASTVLNIVLDPLFIFGWGFFPAMGVQGAAVATVLSRGLASVAGLMILFSGSLGLKITFRHLKPDFGIVKRLISIGVPAAAEMSMKAIGMTVMTGIVAGFGTPALAAYGVGNRVASVVFLPSLGLAQATTTMVGQNLGARKEDRAEKTAYVSSGIAFGILTLFGIATFFLSRPIAETFLPHDEAALTLAARYISIMCLSYGFLGVMNVKNGAFRGAGRTVTAMIFAAISLLVLRVPLGYVLSSFTDLGVDGLWWAVAIANVVGGSLAFWWFTRGRWKIRLVDEGEDARQRAVPDRARRSGLSKPDAVTSHEVEE